jgi:hypothetical protein
MQDMHSQYPTWKLQCRSAKMVRMQLKLSRSVYGSQNRVSCEELMPGPEYAHHFHNGDLTCICKRALAPTVPCWRLVNGARYVECVVTNHNDVNISADRSAIADIILDTHWCPFSVAHYFVSSYESWWDPCLMFLQGCDSMAPPLTLQWTPQLRSQWRFATLRNQTGPECSD